MTTTTPRPTRVGPAPIRPARATVLAGVVTVVVAVAVEVLNVAAGFVRVAVTHDVDPQQAIADITCALLLVGLTVTGVGVLADRAPGWLR